MIRKRIITYIEHVYLHTAVRLVIPSTFVLFFGEIEQKKAVRNEKKQIHRFKGIVKRFGATEAALDRLYMEALNVVKHFRTLEDGAESLSGDLFEKRCDELASLEEEYEEKCAFLDFLEESEITFMKKKKQEERTLRSRCLRFFQLV